MVSAKNPGSSWNVSHHRLTFVSASALHFRPSARRELSGLAHQWRSAEPRIDRCAHAQLPSRAYDYDDPDHYRPPYDSPEIPYTWNAGGTTRLRGDR
jgi:hypothetical protein